MDSKSIGFIVGAIIVLVAIFIIIGISAGWLFDAGSSVNETAIGVLNNLP